MNLAAWNVRGPQALRKQREVSYFIYSNNKPLLVLSETRVDAKFASKMKNRWKANWDCCANFDSCPKSRLWICWNSNILQVVKVRESALYIHCICSTLDSSFTFLRVSMPTIGVKIGGSYGLIFMRFLKELIARGWC